MTTADTAMPQATSDKQEKAVSVAEIAKAAKPQPLLKDNEQAGVTVQNGPAILETIGTQIVAAHAAVRSSFVDVLFHAVKCGLLLIAAKNIVKVGEFEDWFKRGKFGVTKVTRCKYMRLTNRLCKETQSKPGLLLSIRPRADGLPAEFSFDELRLRAVLTDVAAGRSLSDLYADWDIAKRPQSKDGDKTTTSNDTKQAESTKKVLSRWSGIVEEVPKIFSHLERVEQDQLFSQLERLLNQLQAVRLESSSRNAS